MYSIGNLDNVANMTLERQADMARAAETAHRLQDRNPAQNEGTSRLRWTLAIALAIALPMALLIAHAA